MPRAAPESPQLNRGFVTDAGGNRWAIADPVAGTPACFGSGGLTDASWTSITNSKASQRAELEERLAGQSASLRGASVNIGQSGKIMQGSPVAGELAGVASPVWYSRARLAGGYFSTIPTV